MTSLFSVNIVLLVTIRICICLLLYPSSLRMKSSMLFKPLLNTIFDIPYISFTICRTVFNLSSSIIFSSHVTNKYINFSVVDNFCISIPTNFKHSNIDNLSLFDNESNMSSNISILLLYLLYILISSLFSTI